MDTLAGRPGDMTYLEHKFYTTFAGMLMPTVVSQALLTHVAVTPAVWQARYFVSNGDAQSFARSMEISVQHLKITRKPVL